MEILPKFTRFRINGLQISSFYTLNNVLDKETENIFQTPQGTVKPYIHFFMSATPYFKKRFPSVVGVYECTFCGRTMIKEDSERLFFFSVALYF